MPKKDDFQPKFTVIRDTREKKGYWDFDPDKYCNGTISKALKSGDYSIEGLEEVLTIERKRRTAEISTNFFEKRFENELQRLMKFKYAFIICQFNYKELLEFPKGSGIPYKFWNSVAVSGNFLLSKLTNIQVNYDIPVILAGERSEEVAMCIMRQVARNEKLI